MPLVASAAGKRTGRQFGVFALRRDIVPCVQPGIRLRKRTFARRRAYKVVRAHRRRAPQNELLHAHLVELCDHPKRETGPWRPSACVPCQRSRSSAVGVHCGLQCRRVRNAVNIWGPRRECGSSWEEGPPLSGCILIRGCSFALI